MINIEHLDKTYHLKNADVHAVDDVSLHIESGQIYGVIGYSGAGKSTLVRCLNFLEIPDSGSVEIEGFGKVSANQGSLDISQKKLRELSRSIGMIFQHFNLLDRSTVFDNVAYPLKYTGLSKKEIETRVDELLDLVDLADKKYVYPSQLSGGQKQRVAIARALSNNPKVLLSDEATSALDPDATESILKLLRDLNKRLGITIILITHEMSVIKSIANRVAVMENGKVVEEGDIYDIFANPKKEITKKFINSASALSNITKLIENKTIIPTDSKLVKLTFTRDSVGSATISKISREYNVDVNIMLANVDVVNADALGGIIASIEGTKENVQSAIDFLHESNVRVEVIHNA